MQEREHQEAVALMRWVRYQANIRPQLKWLFHIPNGGARSKATAGKLKAEGVLAGVADYFLPAASIAPTKDRKIFNVTHGLFLELKAPGNTYPTQEQKDFLQAVRAQGYAGTWVRGWQPAALALLAYLDGRPIPFDWREFDPTGWKAPKLFQG